MSFAKAKRFDYKAPELDVSPADYYIASSFLKGTSIPKCPRFRNGKDKDETYTTCQRLGYCKQNPQCKIPGSAKSSSTFSLESIAEGNKALKRHDVTRSSVRKRPNKDKKAPAETSIKYDNFVRRMVDSFENMGQEKSSSTDEFIDDDYHSYTSSEEIDNLRRTEEFEFNEVCQAYKELSVRKKDEGSANKSFENAMSQKLNNIEKAIEQFKENFSELGKKIQVGELEKNRDHERERIENVRRYFHAQMSKLSDDKKQEIKDIISKAIRNLNREFEHQRISTLRDSELKIRHLVDQIYATSNASARDIKRLCDDTASNLTRRLMGALKKPNRNLSLTDSRLAEHYDLMVEEVNRTFEIDRDCFNYENICKILSDHLQATQEEVEALEQDNFDITLRFTDTQHALEEQADLIDILHKELEALKEEVNI